MELKRVVVTGIGAITPLGKNAKETWENAKNGVSGAAEITHFDTSKFKTHFACEVKNYNAQDYFDRKEARKMDLYEQYAIIAADEAIKDCGWDLEKIDPKSDEYKAYDSLRTKGEIDLYGSGMIIMPKKNGPFALLSTYYEGDPEILEKAFEEFGQEN